MKETDETSYGVAICQGFEYLLENYEDVFVMGQGLWSPWYVGNSMTDLDVKFGAHRVIDTPVSESACTGAAVGASLAGMRPIVVHPRMDFMLYAMDAVVNQAAKWSSMVGGQANPGLTIRGIINRGGEQGAQHSQSLHSWFAHVPGLRVVMPSSANDARDLLISAVLSPDPVVYIDDRWLYDEAEVLDSPTEVELSSIGPKIVAQGSDITLVATSYATKLSLDAVQALKTEGISAELIDVRVINPLDPSVVIESVRKTGALIVVDGGWASCGLSAEIISSVVEAVDPGTLRISPRRITLPAAPAPTSSSLERQYYFSAETISSCVKSVL